MNAKGLSRTRSRAKTTEGSLVALLRGQPSELTGALDERSQSAHRDESRQASLCWAALGAIHPSRYQYRNVTPEMIETTAAQIRADRLLQPPRVRSIPGRLGEYELVAGHCRLAALRQLARLGIDHPDLRYASGRADLETVEVPVLLDEETNELRARWRALVENEARSDPAPWETCLAIAELLRAVEAQTGTMPSVRDLAVGLGIGVEEAQHYRRAALEIDAPVLYRAGVLGADDLPPQRADAAMTQLSRAALYRVARGETTEERAALLRAELDAVHSSSPTEWTRSGEPVPMAARTAKPVRADGASHLHPDQQANDPTHAPESPARARHDVEQGTRPVASGFQVNIRRAIELLPPRAAADHATRMAPVIQRLISRGATDLSDDARAKLMAHLEAALAALREGESARQVR